jgi:hypothetical protein
MSDLVQYVLDHTKRGECQCGLCADKGSSADPAGHTVNMIFFKVAAQGADKETFLRLTADHEGDFGDCNPLDGVEHGYMELGGWIGDQGLAMQYMALGTSLGVFTLLTPLSMLGFPADDPIVMEMAQRGYVTVQAKTTVPPVEQLTEAEA